MEYFGSCELDTSISGNWEVVRFILPCQMEIIVLILFGTLEISNSGRPL